MPRPALFPPMWASNPTFPVSINQETGLENSWSRQPSTTVGVEFTALAGTGMVPNTTTAAEAFNTWLQQSWSWLDYVREADTMQGGGNKHIVQTDTAGRIFSRDIFIQKSTAGGTSRLELRGLDGQQSHTLRNDGVNNLLISSQDPISGAASGQLSANPSLSEWTYSGPGLVNYGPIIEFQRTGNLDMEIRLNQGTAINWRVTHRVRGDLRISKGGSGSDQALIEHIAPLAGASNQVNIGSSGATRTDEIIFLRRPVIQVARRQRYSCGAFLTAIRVNGEDIAGGANVLIGPSGQFSTSIGEAGPDWGFTIPSAGRLVRLAGRTTGRISDLTENLTILIFRLAGGWGNNAGSPTFSNVQTLSLVSGLGLEVNSAAGQELDVDLSSQPALLKDGHYVVAIRRSRTISGFSSAKIQINIDYTLADEQ